MSDLGSETSALEVNLDPVRDSLIVIDYQYCAAHQQSSKELSRRSARNPWLDCLT